MGDRELHCYTFSVGDMKHWEHSRLQISSMFGNIQVFRLSPRGTRQKDYQANHQMPMELASREEGQNRNMDVDNKSEVEEIESENDEGGYLSIALLLRCLLD